MKNLLKVIILSAMLNGCSTNDFVPDNRVYTYHITTTTTGQTTPPVEPMRSVSCLADVDLVDVPVAPTEKLRAIRGQRNQDTEVVRILVEYAKQLNEALVEQQKLVRSGCR